MKLDKFVDDFLGNVMSLNGLEQVKKYIREDMKKNEFDYDTAKVEFQVFNNDGNYSPRVEISSEGYSDGEIFFIDCHLDE